ncbi:MAG: molybdenum cofactor guanylyltransferase MobA [Hyphomicrobiales bacterium]|nr:molybdenum cofactor guanylyltransferase MobA [Hyphomicrobiales bacterium]
MINSDRIFGLVLAGGQALRMGGDKAFVMLGGQPLASHALRRLRAQCAAVAVSANGDPARWTGFDTDVLEDKIEGSRGPLAGVHAGLVYARERGFEWVVTLPVDTPFAPRDLVVSLASARIEGKARMAVAVTGDRRHHTVALWPVDVADEIARTLIEGQERSVGRFGARLAPVDAWWPIAPFDPFFNINTPADLAQAERILRESDVSA